MKHVVPLLAVVCLVLLIGLGAPGCGCGTDTVPPVIGKLQECCCTLEWTVPDGLLGRDVVVVLQDASDGLWPDARPFLLTALNGGEAATFRVCVSATHPLGATVTLVLRDQDDATEYGRALLVYAEPCGPTLQPVEGMLDLRTVDCGG